MKKVTIPKLKAKALGLFSKIVKLRRLVNGEITCYTCDKPIKYGTSDCQAGHCFSRGAYPALTFTFNNGRPQCFRCNIHLHGNIFEFRERLVQEIGIESFEYMEAHRHDQFKPTRSDYLQMIEDFKHEISILESDVTTF